MKTCEYCETPFAWELRPGRSPRYCSKACRQAAYRARKRLPADLTSRARWCLHTDGTSATNMWMSHKTARIAHPGKILSFACNGDGIICIVITDCLHTGSLDAAAAPLVAACDGTYIEVSPSGQDLHIWGYASPGAGLHLSIGKSTVRTYSRNGAIPVTGTRYGQSPTIFRNLDTVITGLMWQRAGRRRSLSMANATGGYK